MFLSDKKENFRNFILTQKENRDKVKLRKKSDVKNKVSFLSGNMIIVFRGS